ARPAGRRCTDRAACVMVAGCADAVAHRGLGGARVHARRAPAGVGGHRCAAARRPLTVTAREAHTDPISERTPAIRYRVTDTHEGFAAACRALADASGPVAVDVERASGFRYSARAY